TARRIGRVEWAWSPMNSRIEEYFLSTSRTRTPWLLWVRYYDDNWGRWGSPSIAAHVLRKGTKAVEAAGRLLAAYWRSERDGDSKLDHFHLIGLADLLTEDDLMAVGHDVWPVEAPE